MTDLCKLGGGVAAKGGHYPGEFSVHKAFSLSFWRIAALTTAAALGGVSYAEAAVFWSDPDPGLSRARPNGPPHRQGARRSSGKRIDAPVKEAAKPKAPLVIAVSIDKQKVKIYDANGLFAEAPVSTGMRGHPTPMGVFSVIEKDRYHHSNIYSGAPMPYMQRITWSGVAMHAGVLPGYPASHGCIRMPMDFAVKMWGWTKMGARVVVTPGEIIGPAEFSHPLLASHKVLPQPVAAGAPPADLTVDASLKMSQPDNGAKSEVSPVSLELRSTVGHRDEPKLGQTRTADARGAIAEVSAPVTMSDATPSTDAMPSALKASRETLPQQDTMAGKPGASPFAEKNASVEMNGPSGGDSNSKAKSIDDGPSFAKVSETASADQRPAEPKSSETEATEAEPVEKSGPAKTSAETSPTGSDSLDTAEKKIDEAQAPAQRSDAAAKTEVAGSESVKGGETKGETKTNNPSVEVMAAEVSNAGIGNTELPKSVIPKAIDEPGDSAVAATTNVSPSVQNPTKDQGGILGADKPTGEKPNPVLAVPMRTGQIAVFISRKDSKLYVRQNFKPVFDIPVTIAASDRPLGTHIFTAQVDKDDANLLHWSAVSLPTSAKYTERDEDERRSRKRKAVVAAEPKAGPVPDSPVEALDRLTLPADVMAHIYEAFTTGGSIIVSDQGIRAGETGEGTDFIVSLR